MEIRQLRYAVLLDEHRHFGRAAREAFITQPAFSQQIAALEQELAVRLFDRRGSNGDSVGVSLRATNSTHIVPFCARHCSRRRSTEPIH